MQIFELVIQLLSFLVPAVSRMLSAINASNDGGIKTYDRLLTIAKEQVAIVAAQAATPSTMPGTESKWERNLRLYSSAIYLTLDAVQRIGLTVKDHQVSQAVNDAYTTWKMETAPNSETP